MELAWLSAVTNPSWADDHLTRPIQRKAASPAVYCNDYICTASKNRHQDRAKPVSEEGEAVLRNRLSIAYLHKLSMSYAFNRRFLQLTKTSMRFSFYVLLLCAAFTSCRTQRSTITNYLENSRDTSGANIINIIEPVIQKDDLLSIKVYSLSADPTVDALYNLPEQTVAGSSTTTATAGFLVNAAGNIEYPRLGTIHVEGLKKSELADLIKAKLDGILKSPSVLIRFLNYRITVLGEVRSPGTFSIPTERITIFEALGLAGDITEFGNKTTVKIMRENGGQASSQTVDLTSKGIFTSPYYRLQQNDFVFVEQTRRKLQQQEQQNTIQQIGIATGILTAIALIVNFIR